MKVDVPEIVIQNAKYWNIYNMKSGDISFVISVQRDDIEQNEISPMIFECGDEDCSTDGIAIFVSYDDLRNLRVLIDHVLKTESRLI